MKKSPVSLIRIMVPGLFVILIVGFVGLVIAGNLDTTTYPGTSSLYSLEEIYQFLANVDSQTRQDETSHSFLPADGPSPTMHTTTDIYDLLQRLPATGAESSYIAGDDGNLRMGATKRYRDLMDGTVLDLNTNLQWVKNFDMIRTFRPDLDTEYGAGKGMVKWGTAFYYINRMNTGAETNYGYQDWRLPNVLELATLVDYGRNNPSLDPIFTNSELSGYYWTSTTLASETSYAYCIYFANGVIRYYKKSQVYSRVVAVRNYKVLNESTY